MIRAAAVSHFKCIHVCSIVTVNILENLSSKAKNFSYKLDRIDRITSPEEIKLNF